MKRSLIAKGFATCDLFSAILKGEEERVDFLETQLELIGKIGRENYIQLRAELLGERLYS